MQEGFQPFLHFHLNLAQKMQPLFSALFRLKNHEKFGG